MSVYNSVTYQQGIKCGLDSLAKGAEEGKIEENVFLPGIAKYCQ